MQLPENMPPAPAKIELYSPTGKLLYKAQPLSRYHKIETTHLPSGLYLIRLWDGERCRTEKVVVE
ncbi:MAG: T9SS type A sorting domain-containing protein [Bacteroidales bacterium]